MMNLWTAKNGKTPQDWIYYNHFSEYIAWSQTRNIVHNIKKLIWRKYKVDIYPYWAKA